MKAKCQFVKAKRRLERRKIGGDATYKIVAKAGILSFVNPNTIYKILARFISKFDAHRVVP